MKKLTTKDLLELLELEKRSTEGRWEDHNWDVMEKPHVVAHSLWNGKDNCNGHFDVPCTPENTAFIAQFRNAAKLLIEEVIAARGVIKNMGEQSLLDEMSEETEQDADLEYAYDWFILRARAHLAKFVNAEESEE